MDIENYEPEVSTEMERRFAISWTDASGGREPLAQAIAAGESPTEFVEWFGENYDLVSRSEGEGW